MIAGQHSVAALKALISLCVNELHRKPPRTLSFVSAEIVRHTAPLEVRKYVAGRKQFQQQVVKECPLSAVLQRLLDDDVRAKRQAWERMVAAITQAGHEDSKKPAVCSLPLPSCGARLRKG